jgi:hypothetical protein
MRQTHPAIDSAVEPGATVWRYFDFPKFVSFISNRGLWFSRADLLGDPLEGSFTRAREAERRRYLANPPEGQTPEELGRIFAHNSAIYARNVRCAYVNCWHLGDHESMALWRGYGGGPYGVAVRTTFGSLSNLLPLSFGDTPIEAIFMARVRYIDYASEVLQIDEPYNMFAPFVWKSLAYENESEVRALFIDVSGYFRDDPPKGHLVGVDLQKLVQQVTVSPLAPDWFAEAVGATCARFGFRFDIQRSIVYREPIY